MNVTDLGVADWNLPIRVVREIAKHVGGEIVVGRGPDHAVLRNGKVKRVWRAPDKRGSDHYPILFVVELPDGTEVRVLFWNVYVGQEPSRVLRDVADLVDQHQPHVVALVETYRCREVLAQIPGYVRFQGRTSRKNTEAGEIAVLVRRDVTVLHGGWLRMSLGWIGPKHGHKHGPRRFVRVRLQFSEGGPVLRVLAAHLPTGGYGGPNDPAVREAVSHIVKWFNPRPRPVKHRRPRPATPVRPERGPWNPALGPNPYDRPGGER